MLVTNGHEMEFYQQVKAARAILGWTQENLANRASLSVPAIKSLETGSTDPMKRTQSRIIRAFEEEGIIFTAHGIEQREERIFIFDSFLDILDDAQAVLKKGDYLLLHCADESRNTPEVREKALEMIRDGIKMRLTICHGDTIMMMDPKNYRWIDAEFFADSEVQVIYADRYVLHVPERGKDTFVLIKNSSLATMMRKQFEYWWRHGCRVRKT